MTLKKLEFYIKVLAPALLVIICAIVNFIGQPKKNADAIQELATETKEKMTEMKSEIRENVLAIRQQDKEISRTATKLESIESSVLDARADIRALTNMLMDK